MTYPRADYPRCSMPYRLFGLVLGLVLGAACIHQAPPPPRPVPTVFPGP